nr:dehydrogenase/reductase SDR family member 12-like [Ciona intestinalis]|eukprot:XP_002132115.1 dehydrogenase/reductase SDR family member 12-like [Ciona intestinalis]
MTVYRKALLFTKGLIYESKNGYINAAKQFDQNDVSVDVTGHVFMVTGANSGIGKEVTKELASRGGEVHMVCRSLERANAARDEIVKATKNEKIFVHIVDLSNIRSVGEFAKSFSESHGRLDTLVNNAGEMVADWRLTETENLEVNFATNSMSHFVLTESLLPLMEKSERPRVVNVTSSGMLLQCLNPKCFSKEKPNNFEAIIAYAQCKRQLTVLTEHWAEKHSSVHFSCMHPGWVDTPAAKRGLGDFYEKMSHKFRTPAQGADTVVWLCLAEKVLSIPSGSYFQDRKVSMKHLPLATTKESKRDRSEFLKCMKNLADSCTK